MFTPLLLLLTASLTHAQSGIPIDSAWKMKIHEFAEKNIQHPSWGLAHAERDYRNSLQLAATEGVTLDLDVLFASAFLHDLGGIGAFQKKGVDHAVRSAVLAEPLLLEAGFPMTKWARVKEMILGHTYYGAAPASPEAIIFRDADILDFLGSLGVARILAVTEEAERTMSLPQAFALLRKFEAELPPKLITSSARRDARNRTLEMRTFFRAVKRESFNGESL